MGLPHALLKVDKPEVFNLGKGLASRSWSPVFGRNLGMFFIDGGAGNFLEPMKNLDKEWLVKQLIAFDKGYSGPAEDVATRIIEWMGDDACILSNGWEEMSEMIEDGNIHDIQEEFSDTAAVVTIPLSQYKQTGSVWG